MPETYERFRIERAHNKPMWRVMRDDGQVVLQWTKNHREAQATYRDCMNTFGNK